MGFWLLVQNTRELWKEWKMRLLVLLSLFLQLTLATQVSRRKYKFSKSILIMIWTAYVLADSIANLALGIFSNQLANIKETKGTIDPKSQITAFWAPFLLLHLGGPDTITAFVQEDHELWLRQFVRLCIQVGLVGFICYMALSGSTLSMLAAGIILVGLMKYAERILCLYLASKGQLRDSMLSLPHFVPIYPRIMEQYTVKEMEGYQIKIDEFYEVPAPEDFQVDSGQTSNKENARTPVGAYEFFKVFKLLFLGLIRNFGDLEASKRMFMHMDGAEAFRIMEIELGFMYDLLYTKAPLMKSAWGWGIIRWVISLSVPCAGLVFFSLQDKKDYPKVDICVTFLLISVAIFIEIYSLLLAISSDWIHHGRLQRSTISSAIALLGFNPSQRWSNSVAQLSLLRSSIRKRKSIFRHVRFAKLHEVVEKNFYIDYEKFDDEIKGLIFSRMTEMVIHLEGTVQLKSVLASLKLEALELLKRSSCDHLAWSVEMEFDRNILTWHIATELRYHDDRGKMQKREDIANSSMSLLVSRYMLYLLVCYPSMLPTGIGMLRYKDTSVDAQKFFEDKLAVMSKDEGSVSSVVREWVKKLFKKETHIHTGVESCHEALKSRESQDHCELCYLLLRVRTDLLGRDMRRGKSRSVLFDACHLADQLKSVDTWDMIGKIWVRMLIYSAYQCKGSEHLESLSRGGELLSHIWLLMAHLGMAEAVQAIEPEYAAKLVNN